MSENEIPIANSLADEVDIEAEIIDEVSSDDEGGLNESNELDMSEISYDIGDIFIILLDNKDSPILCKVDEIITNENILKMIDENEKILIFHFNDGEIINKTDDYEILDIIKVKKYDPENIETEYIEHSFDVDEITNKKYSKLELSDNLLSAMIHSMNIYDNPLLINEAQESINNILELINTERVIDLYKESIIPVIGDELKGYDLLGYELENELIEEKKSAKDSVNYREYLLDSLKFSKPINVTNGVGLTTNEYNGTYLRQCIQDDNCIGKNGNNYRYDERKNNNFIITNNEILLPPNKLRFVGLLEEPLNIHIYSVNKDSLKNFNVFEKYIYETYNKINNLYKKDRIYNELINPSHDLNCERELNNFLFHILSDKCDLSILSENLSNILNKVTDLIINDSNIKDSIYNFNDIQKILFKYNINYEDLPIDDRRKLDELLSKNIKRYKKQYILFSKKIHDKDVNLLKNSLSDEKRVKLAHDLIFSLNKRKERNYYLKRFIDLFTRSRENELESNDYLYNKFTNEKLLCKHYLYEVNIENDNDVFDVMKTKYGSPPEDGYISCKICGSYLCNEDTSLIDGYDDDKAINNREVLLSDNEDTLLITEYLENNEEYVKIIKDLSSIFADLSDKDIYDILLSFELLDHNILPDIRYEMKNVSSTDIHPRVSKRADQLKKLETKTKDKSEKKKIKQQRENIIKDFQIWLKDTNRLLMITALTALFIQTSVVNLDRDLNKPSIEILDLKEKKLNNRALDYLCVKLRKLCEKYSSEKFWNQNLDLFNEKEYDTNSIQIQLGLTVKYCIEPNFAKVTERIQNLEEYIKNKDKIFYKEEWVTFKPLKDNLLVKNNSELIEKLKEKNIDYYRKLYGGYLVENNSLLTPKSISYELPIYKVLNIPEIEIFNNNSFKKLFRYAVSLYGIHDNNVFITLTVQRMIETSNKKEELIKILKKNDWNDNTKSFKQLNFKKIRNNLIPDILSLYNDKNTLINSCYSDEKSCNHFIHNAINTYDLCLLNTFPKRIYNYIPPIVYPELSFDRLKNMERYDINGNRIKNIVELLFNLYKKDEFGNIIKNYNDIFYLQFYSKSSIMNTEIIDTNKLKNIERNEKNFKEILETLIKNNSLIYNEIIKHKEKYTKDDYKFIENISRIDNRFHYYLSIYKEKCNLSDKDLIVSLYDIFTHIIEYDKAPAINDKIDLDCKHKFSDIINNYLEKLKDISLFLASSDDIEISQKRRFENIFKEYNTDKTIKFNSDNIYSILEVFINDTNLTYDYLTKYMNDINQIISRLINVNKLPVTELSKTWKCTEKINNEFTDFITKDSHSVYLKLHNNIFVNSKDNYIGFNRYLVEKENKVYLRMIYDKLKKYLNDLDLIRGSNMSKYNQKYMNIFIKYIFVSFLNEIVLIVQELKDNNSDITSDANDLFQLLQKRDEDCIDDMNKLYSQLLIDIITHILYTHYDTGWLFLNEQKLDLSNRLSKQKEREKQILINEFESVTKEERFAKLQKQKMGITLFYKEAAEKASEYVKSDEYAIHNSDERKERLSELFSDRNLEFEYSTSELENEELSDSLPIPNLIPVSEEQDGKDQYEEYDGENEDYKEDYLDDEYIQEFNE